MLHRFAGSALDSTQREAVSKAEEGKRIALIKSLASTGLFIRA
jgi:hypothetical protein